MKLDKKRVFVTLFPSAENVHLMKDVGMIPYIFAKELNYKSIIVSSENGEYEYIKKYLVPLEQYFLKKNSSLYELLYIYKNAKKIDVLNMYHISIHHSLLCLFLYKKLNPHGVAYLKTDLDYRGIEDLEKYSGLKKALVKILLREVDIVSSETRQICKRLERIYKRKILFIPNGVYDFHYINTDERPMREKQFLTVGRLGTEQKNTEILIQAFVKIMNMCDWNLVLVGSMQQSLRFYLAELFKKYDGLEKRILYKGEISEKEHLTEMYKTAECFVLPSRWESFGLVIIEAAQNGDYLVLSDKIPVAPEIISSDEIGQIVSPTVSDLANAMYFVTKKKQINHDLISSVVKLGFQWSEICNKLNNEILRVSFEKLK